MVEKLHDEFPAGFVSIEGSFAAKHREVLLNLVKTHALRAAGEHCLRRLMDTQDTPEGVLLTTPDTHRARELGSALHDAYGGKVSYSYADGQEMLRVHWKR